MKERPILFSAPMVRAILEGRKTQTRRVVKPAPQMVTDKRVVPWTGDATALQHLLESNGHGCRYGHPGDRLWVRETWCTDSSLDAQRPSSFIAWPVKYLADNAARTCGAIFGNTNGKTRPSIYMPRWASRITLEVTGVRIERLHDITEADAMAEGFQPKPWGPWWQGYRDMGGLSLVHQESPGESPPDWMIEPKRMQDRPWLNRSAFSEFRALWWSINGADSWDANPWVWAIEFKRLEQPHA